MSGFDIICEKYLTNDDICGIIVLQTKEEVEMKQVHISQIYPCSRVSLAVELQYIVEIGKYLKDFDRCLSIDGVELDDILKKSKYWDYFKLALEEGWVVDCSEHMGVSPIDYSVQLRNVAITEDAVFYDSKDDMKRKESMEYRYRTPKPIQVVMCNKDNNNWEWSLDYEYVINNTALGSTGAEMVWVSLLAYVAVRRLLFSTPTNFIVNINFSLAETYMVLSSFILLQEETDVCKGWCYYRYADTVDEYTKLHNGYTAWYAKGVEEGMLARHYTDKEKLENLKKLKLRKGDVCFLYERRAGQKLDYLKSIEGFHFCIITDITSRSIELTVVNNKKTQEQGKKDYANFTMATKELYGFKNPYTEANLSKRSYMLTDIGVEYCMYGEQYFITRCTNDDFKQVWVGADGYKPARLNLPALDLVYWILKDYDIEFDEPRFIENYFGGKEPLYTQYHKTGSVDRMYYASMR